VKKLFGIFVLFMMCIVSSAYAIEYPQFKSAVSTTGIAVNFDTLYQRADQLKMVHDVIEHDSKHIVWRYKDSGRLAIVKEDGTVVIASPSAFSLDVKNGLNFDLNRAKDLIKSTGGGVSGAPLIYYVDDPYLYRVITYDFKSNFDLKLSVPNCTLQKAVLSVTGTDLARPDVGSGVESGQHYSIDDKEVSGCDAINCETGNDYEPYGFRPGSGISCVPGECQYTGINHNPIGVSVSPVDITSKIAPGLHKISASGIDGQHTMTIEAVTSPSNGGMLLYSNDYKTVINETRSLPMTGLYALIKPNTEAINTTSKPLMTNATK
jgi:hypothetical protein